MSQNDDPPHSFEEVFIAFFWRSRWGKTILTTVIVAGFLLTAYEFAVKIPELLSPAPLTGLGHNGLTERGRTLAKHEQTADPFGEHFIRGTDADPPFARIGDQIQGSQAENSWCIYNPLDGAVPYVFTITQQDLAAARQYGWRMTMRVKLIETLGVDGAAHINFDTNSRRYDVNVVRAYPTLRSNLDVSVRLNDGVRQADAAHGQETHPLPGDVFHTIVLTFDPSEQSATLYVDDRVMLKGYEGHTFYTNPNPWNSPVLMFGASNAKSCFQLAEFEVFQRP